SLFPFYFPSTPFPPLLSPISLHKIPILPSPFHLIFNPQSSILVFTFFFRLSDIMNRRSRRSGNSQSETFHKYLKPGALAQIRNSRMIARFNRVNLVSQIYSTTSSSLPIDSGLLQVNIVDASPSFAGRVYGPLSLQRKKLLASKSLWFLASSPTNLTPDSPPDPVIEVLGG
uniref:Uncharacterized protein n=3 Tax=Cucumis melo TaxID=3656 RepID=A0A9I9DHT4_CUCME